MRAFASAFTTGFGEQIRLDPPATSRGLSRRHRSAVLHRDRDAAFQALDEAIRSFGIEQVVSAPRSPWQNPYVERVIGSIRRDLLDHVIVLGPEHARRLLLEYQRYDNEIRTHLALEKDCPVPRPVQGPETGKRIVALPVIDGLHHRYERRAA